MPDTTNMPPLSSNPLSQMQCCSAAGVELLHSSSAAKQSQPVAFRKGDVQTVVGTVLCKQPCSAVPVASLAVMWQRSRYRHTKAEPPRRYLLRKCIACNMHRSNAAHALCAAIDVGSALNLAGSTLACWPTEEAETCCAAAEMQTWSQGAAAARRSKSLIQIRSRQPHSLQVCL